MPTPRFTGNVGIGTSTPSETFEVIGSAKIGNNVVDVYGQFYTDVAGAFNIEAANYANTVKKNIGLAVYGGSVGVGTMSPSLKFTVNGTAGGTSAWQVVSDRRIKKDIKPLSGALAMVSQLHGVRFNWRDVGERDVGKNLALPTNEKQIGLIAQDVEKIVPEAVSKPKDESEPYQIKMGDLIPVLIEAIKEQQGQIDALRSEVAALKAGR